MSVIAQIAAIAAALCIARFLMRSRLAILLVCFLGAFGAMVAHIAANGQGAFLFVALTPVIYFFANSRRTNLRTL
jgi:hypothetical protein